MSDRIPRLRSAGILALALVALAGAGSRGDESRWVGTWAASPQLTVLVKDPTRDDDLQRLGQQLLDQVDAFVTQVQRQIANDGYRLLDAGEHRCVPVTAAAVQRQDHGIGGSQDCLVVLIGSRLHAVGDREIAARTKSKGLQYRLPSRHPVAARR